MDLINLTLDELQAELDGLYANKKKNIDEDTAKKKLIQEIEEARIYRDLRKLSELDVESGLDNLGQILVEIGKIVDDSEIVNAWTNKGSTITGNDFAKLILKLTPILTTKYKHSIIKILAILTDRTIEEMAKYNLVLALRLIQKVLTEDRDFVNFFTSFRALGSKAL